MSKIVSRNEMELIQVLLEHEPCSIVQLEGYLEVTANAVRQRLNRLVAAGLVDRESKSEGRGRPNHVYQLTKSGRKTSGNNLSDLADALWQEIQLIPDEAIRSSIIKGVSKRLASNYSSKIDGQSVEERLTSAAKLLSERAIPVVVEKDNEGLPILKMLSCPYPDLADESQAVCEMERRLISEVTGGSFELGQCRKDGDQCCSFQVDTPND